MSKENKTQENKQMYNLLTKAIREEINQLKNNEWQEFIKKQGNNPLNSKPFWQRLNKLKGKKNNKSIPTLKKDGIIYEKDYEKANLFSNILRNTFSDENGETFDNQHKIKIEEVVNNHDFDKHQYNDKNCFKLKDLNDIIKKLKNHSAPGQDKIHNLMLKNSSREFR